MSFDLNHLQRELEETRAHLAEAEDALNAIRNGEVDGLVMSGPEGQHVLTLRGAQEPYRLLMEQMSEGALTMSREGIIIYANQAFASLLKKPRKQIVGAELRDFVSLPWQSAFVGLVNEAWDTATCGEITLCAADGSSVPLRLGLSQLKLEDHSVICVVATDLTEVKNSEEQLRSMQLYTRSLIESSIDAIMTTDPRGVITDINHQMEKLTGHTRDELIGSPFKNYFTDPQRAEEAIHLVLREGSVANYELTARGKHNQETVVSYSANIFNDQYGELQGVFAAARDVTERKRIEQALQDKNIELENAILAKDRFLASMSHELRTPLNAIIGFTGTLLMKLPGPLTSDQEKQLRTVQNSGKHLLALINDLLDVAKIDSGKVEIKYEPVVCQSVIEEVAASLRPLAEGKGLDFVVEIPEGSVNIESDRRILSQILINLTNNAIKFTDKGRVQIALNLQTSDEHSSLLFQVSDTGIGIQPEDKKKLFQAFQQVDLEHRREGTGLGLYLSQRLAELIGGRIELESEFGKGSVFRLAIPNDQERIAQRHAQSFR